MVRALVACCLIALLTIIPFPVSACSFCPAPLNKESLGQELDRAKLIVFGYAANPRLNTEPGALPGSGKTDFHIEKVIKNDPFFGDRKVITIERYLPVLDPKNPPRFLIFCDVDKGKLDPYLGRQANSAAVVDYLDKARGERAKGKVPALRFYAQYLNHPDDLVAEDAFLEFARSKDEDVGQVAKTLDPALIRKLLQKPGLDADRISLFAFLLGSCGNQDDAVYLRQRIAKAKKEDLRALDGMLGGLIAIQPKEGWKLTQDILASHQEDFLKKFAALRTIRFYMGWKPEESRPKMLAAYKGSILDGEMADLAIEDLRRWKTWEHTTLILAQYGKATHAAPIVKRGILRYALRCPLPEAQRILDRLRSTEGELLQELTESLELENPK